MSGKEISQRSIQKVKEKIKSRCGALPESFWEVFPIGVPIATVLSSELAPRRMIDPTRQQIEVYLNREGRIMAQLVGSTNTDEGLKPFVKDLGEVAEERYPSLYKLTSDQLNLIEARVR